MRVGVVSDTHNNLVNVRRIAALFDDAGVDRVVHTGDITQPKTLDVLARMAAPLTAVFGNNDEREPLAATAAVHGIELFEPPLELDWAGRRIVVVHDPKEHPDVWDRGADVILHGHEHRHVLERVGRTLVFNPGESAGHMTGFNAVGVVDLVALEATVLKF